MSQVEYLLLQQHTSHRQTDPGATPVLSWNQDEQALNSTADLAPRRRPSNDPLTSLVKGQ